jgi:uncharacterized membrane protein YfcA
MDPALLAFLTCAVFGAAMLQSATGIGYGVIAGPVLLVVLNGPEAIQISTLHNFLIGLFLVPVLRARVQVRVLGLLCLGALAGIAIGFTLLSALSVTALKLIAAGMVLFVTLTLLADMMRRREMTGGGQYARGETLAVGALSGVMGGMLAMPGPLAATWMSVRGFDMGSVRATILAFFIFAYGVNILSYVTLTGFDPQTLKLASVLTIPLAVGVLVGGLLAKRLSERVFRYLLLGVLAATILGILLSL